MQCSCVYIYRVLGFCLCYTHFFVFLVCCLCFLCKLTSLNVWSECLEVSFCRNDFCWNASHILCVCLLFVLSTWNVILLGVFTGGLKLVCSEINEVKVLCCSIYWRPVLSVVLDSNLCSSFHWDGCDETDCFVYCFATFVFEHIYTRYMSCKIVVLLCWDSVAIELYTFVRAFDTW